MSLASHSISGDGWAKILLILAVIIHSATSEKCNRTTAKWKSNTSSSIIVIIYYIIYPQIQAQYPLACRLDIDTLKRNLFPLCFS